MKLRNTGIFLLLFIAVACSTKRGKQTAYVRMSYHDITTRYNYYFNAKLIMNLAVKGVLRGQKDDYTQLLALSNIPDADQMSGAGGDMDKVILKTSNGIKKHPNSKWVDDSYLLLGKAKFLRGEYPEALAAFQVITAKYDEGIREQERKPTKGKRKKLAAMERQGINYYYDPFFHFLRHKPARYKALVWIIRSYTAMSKYAEAEGVIALVKGMKLFPDQLKEDLQIAITELNIKQGNIPEAINALHQAINLTDKNKIERRYYYVLGQLYSQNNQATPAIEAYNEVLELNPDYEMEFNAKINIVNLSRKENYYTNAEIIALLNSMLKNDKYERYRGQIYYALGEISLSENEQEEALGFFMKAVQSSRENNKPEQQVLAYRQIADIYFHQENYVPAKMYYDSTLALMAAEAVDFDKLERRSAVLDELVDQINVISHQDSLQRLSQMTPEELERHIAEQEAKKREEEKAQEERNNNTFINTEDIASSTWPFDNPSQRAEGYNEFVRIWGERPLEDDWRRKQKTGTASINGNETDGKDNEGSETVGKGDDKDAYSGIPRTPEELAASNRLIADAYWNMARIYRDNLDNNVKAYETYKTLHNRFPENRYNPELLYNLYLLSKESDPSATAEYKKLILNGYPNSLFAKIILDPEYVEETQKETQVITDYYASTFDLYEQENYRQVIQRKLRADSIYPNSNYKSRFDMLEALAYGEMDSMTIFKQKLERIVNNYPGEEVKSKALDILNMMDGKAYMREEVGVDKAGKFRADPNEEHYLVVLFYSITAQNETVKNALATYNTNNHSLKKYNISSLLLNSENELIVVKSMPNMERAMSYYNDIHYNQLVFQGTDPTTYQVFPITKTNYGIFFREKDIPAYLQFFTKNYIEE